jgi:hypothetical protein
MEGSVRTHKSLLASHFLTFTIMRPTGVAMALRFGEMAVQSLSDLIAVSRQRFSAAIEGLNPGLEVLTQKSLLQDRLRPMRLPPFRSCFRLRHQVQE